MATVVLTAAVGAIKGLSTGAAIALSTAAAIAGGLIDRALFSPRAQDQFGLRLDDKDVQTASEGSPVRRAFGPTVRLPGR